MIDPTFRNTNRLFVQLFIADENDLTINYFLKYYLLLAEIEDCSLLIKKQFFDKAIKKNKKHMKKMSKWQKTMIKQQGILDCSYHQNYYRIIKLIS